MGAAETLDGRNAAIATTHIATNRVRKTRLESMYASDRIFMRVSTEIR
jgi:hypothetical protein